ncbi:ASKHA domain-containing protein [Eubacteriaceae bacterium ES3]|nr:ASKHA domain-containing protein [Eubacteriaceae bacterium ES3]
MTQNKAVLSLKVEDETYKIKFRTGQTIRQIIDATRFRIYTGCRGNGACGQCQVRILNGEVNAPTISETTGLLKQQLNSGIRLACQAIPLGDVVIECTHRICETEIRYIAEADYSKETVEILNSFNWAGQEPVSKYGLAVDLGTSNIRVSLWDLGKRKRITGRIGSNKQGEFGSDILRRIRAACEDEKNVQVMSRLVREFLGEVIEDIEKKEFINKKEIGKVTVVGNTAMLTLLTGQNYQLMLNPENWEKEIACEFVDQALWSAELGIANEAEIEVIQPLYGFVGSDLLASVLMAQMVTDDRISLLVDFGTNSEIALWDKKCLWVTSASGGPAFEGYGIRFGMPASPGAVCQVDSLDQQEAFQVVDGRTAVGLCGSAVVDMIALGLEAGVVSEKGKLNVSDGRLSMTDDIFLDERDIDVFQRAKSAVGSGISCLLDQAHVKEIERLIIAGSFGRYLNEEHARAVGLIPGAKKVEIYGNAALQGCELMLLSPQLKDFVNKIRNGIKIINLSNYSEFDEVFINNLFLKKMEG